MENVTDYITNWLKQYAEKSGLNGFVVGVSGGIDSAVTSTLCARTGLPVLCLDMPIRQQRDQQQRATEHINWLEQNFANASGKTIDLTDVFDAFAMATQMDAENIDLALANSRARLRMTTLYQYASVLGRLVAGTGNKIEDFGIGFYTKYGDGGVDLSPIADLTKTEVYAIAKHLGVIDAIIKAPPTDGLWDDDRTDEDQIGATYPQMEWAMQQMELGKTVNDFKGDERRIVETYLRHHNKNKHKMSPIPVCAIPTSLK